jgi:hypothetical protein
LKKQQEESMKRQKELEERQLKEFEYKQKLLEDLRQKKAERILLAAKKKKQRKRMFEKPNKSNSRELEIYERGWNASVTPEKREKAKNQHLRGIVASDIFHSRNSSNPNNPLAYNLSAISIPVFDTRGDTEDHLTKVSKFSSIKVPSSIKSVNSQKNIGHADLSKIRTPTLETEESRHDHHPRGDGFMKCLNLIEETKDHRHLVLQTETNSQDMSCNNRIKLPKIRQQLEVSPYLKPAPIVSLGQQPKKKTLVINTRESPIAQLQANNYNLLTSPYYSPK